MASYVEKEKIIDILADVDVLVAGGGPSGMAAAIGAAREGVNVMLIERYGCFGGTITQAGVEGFGWYRHEETVEAGGLVFEFENNAKKMGASTDESQSISQALDAEQFKYVADRMIINENIRPLLHCMVVDAIIENDIIKGVIVESKSGRQAIMAKRVIDCTGDADIAARAGVPYYKAPKEKLMSTTPIFNLKNIDAKKFNDYIKNDLKPTYRDWFGDAWGQKSAGKVDHLFSPYIEKPFVEAKKNKELILDKGVSYGGTWSTIDENSNDITQMNMVFIRGYDCTNVEDLTKVEINGRRYVYEAIDILKEKVPGFENAKIRNFGMTIGTRESRKIEGQYSLTEEDVLGEARFEDSIGIYPEFVDGGPYLYIPTTGRYFQVPYGVIVPKKIDNLLVAGRSISGDVAAHCAFRNMSCCVLTGQGAGVAAATSIKNETTTSNVNIKDVQKALKKQNVRIE